MNKLFLSITGLLFVHLSFSQCDFSKTHISKKTSKEFCIQDSFTSYQFTVNETPVQNMTYQWEISAQEIAISGEKTDKVTLHIEEENKKLGDTYVLKVELTSDQCPNQKAILSHQIEWKDVVDASKVFIVDIDPICINNDDLQTFEIKGEGIESNSVDWWGIDSITNYPIIITSSTSIFQKNMAHQIVMQPYETSRMITLVASVKNECGNSDWVTKMMRIDNIPTPATITNDTIKVCSGEKVFLTGNEPSIGVGTWEIANTYHANTDLENINKGNTELYQLEKDYPFIATWSISNGACQASSLAYQVAEIQENCVISNTENKKNTEVILYPNPFHEYIQLKSSQDIKRIEVRDCLGNILEHYDTISDKIYLGKELQSGTYFVLIYTEKGIQIENIIKSRFSVNR